MRNSNNKIPYKTLTELDQMSEDQIKLHRVDILENSHNYHNEECTDKRYLDELSFYKDVRFKESKIQVQREWKEKGYHKLMSHSMLYQTGLLSDFPDDGEFMFITPMPMPDDMDIEKFRTMNDIFN